MRNSRSLQGSPNGGVCNVNFFPPFAEYITSCTCFHCSFCFHFFVSGTLFWGLRLVFGLITVFVFCSSRTQLSLLIHTFSISHTDACCIYPMASSGHTADVFSPTTQPAIGVLRDDESQNADLGLSGPAGGPHGTRSDNGSHWPSAPD